VSDIECKKMENIHFGRLPVVLVKPDQICAVRFGSDDGAQEINK
jgi:hypothetical protein